MATFNLTGSALQNASIQGMATKLTEALGDRIRPVSVVFKVGDDMPKRSDGGPSFGFWKPAPDVRQIWLWNELDEYPVVKTFAHEAMHVVDTDWLTGAQRREIMALMFPPPIGWGDQIIGGVKHKYVALPSEVFAVYASAAVCGFDKPAYRALFKRHVKSEKWPLMKDVTLRDTDTEDRVPEPGIEPVPSPPDPMDDLAAQLAAARASLVECLGAKDVAEIALALAEGQLAQAKAEGFGRP